MKKKKHHDEYLESLAEMVHAANNGKPKQLIEELDAMYGILEAIKQDAKKDDPTMCVVMDMIQTLTAVMQMQLMAKEVV